MANLALGFVLIAGLLVAPAYAVYSNEHLEVVDVEEVADDEGRITFVGNVMNANEYQSINPAQVFLTLNGFDLVRIVPEAVQIEDAVPTAVTGATWGQIKQNSLSPAPRRTQ